MESNFQSMLKNTKIDEELKAIKMLSEK